MALGNTIVLGPKIGKFDLEHEIVHVNQYLRYPLIFPILYYIELFKKGYKNNKYEKEAFEKQTNT